MDATATNVVTPKITWDGKSWYASLPVDDAELIDMRWTWCIGRPARSATCLVHVTSSMSA